MFHAPSYNAVAEEEAGDFCVMQITLHASLVAPAYIAHAAHSLQQPFKL